MKLKHAALAAFVVAILGVLAITLMRRDAGLPSSPDTSQFTEMLPVAKSGGDTPSFEAVPTKVETQTIVCSTDEDLAKIKDPEFARLVKMLRENQGDQKKTEEAIKEFEKKGSTVVVTFGGDQKEQALRELDALYTKMTPEQKQKYDQSIKDQVQKQFEEIPAADKAAWRDHLNSPEGKRALQQGIYDYFKKLNAEERKAIDPVFVEVLNSLNKIAEGK